MAKAVYSAEARVTGGRANGRRRTSDGALDVELRLPPELGGAGGGTNPEQLFAVGGGRYELGVELRIELPSIADAEQAATVVREAHQACPYSNATRGNIDVALVVNGVALED